MVRRKRYGSRGEETREVKRRRNGKKERKRRKRRKRKRKKKGRGTGLRHREVGASGDKGVGRGRDG